MKLIDGIKFTGRKIVIPDCSRNELPELFKELGFKVGAEIGVLTGGFTEMFCKAGFKMYAVDPWIIFPDYIHPRGQKKLDYQYEYTKNLLAPYDCTILRKFSMDALADIPDGSLDFVYIDGNHHFRYIAEDLVEWTKKVRSGGIISGHDYFYSGKTGQNAMDVRWVVDAYMGAHHIQTYYQLGRQRKKDKWPSWMFIKP